MVVIDPLEKKELNGALCVRPDAQESRGDHAGVVDDEYITLLKVILDIVEVFVDSPAGLLVQHEQSRCRSVLDRNLGNKLFRQIVIKIFSLHDVLLLVCYPKEFITSEGILLCGREGSAFLIK